MLPSSIPLPQHSIVAPPAPAPVPQASAVPVNPPSIPHAPPQPSTPHRPHTYTFHIETPAAVRARLNQTPSRNARRNQQQATAILFTSNHHPPTAPHSVLDSPTPARTAAPSVFPVAPGSGSDDTAHLFEQLNLQESSIPSPARLPQTSGPRRHHRPVWKSPPRPKHKSKASDVWTFMEAQEDGRKYCMFCKCVEMISSFYFI